MTTKGMICDAELCFTKQIDGTLAQAITASAASTNKLKLHPGTSPDAGKGSRLKVVARVTEDFTTLTGLTIGLRTDDDVAFGSPTTLISSAKVLLAALVKGKVVELLVPEGCEKHLDLYFTVDGSNAGAGKIEAFLAPCN